MATPNRDFSTDLEQAFIDMCRAILDYTPPQPAVKPSETVCGHRGCTLRPGHIPGHTDR
jgi:hypothetical protein